MVKLEDILSLEYGKGLPENERLKGNYPVFGSNGIVGYHKQSLVKGPGIVVGRKGTIGAVNWVDSDFWPIDTTYFVKTKNENVFLKWLFFKLKQSNLPKLSQSDVVPGLKRELVYHITIPLPPLPEQRRIAEVLGIVDSAIQKVGGAIEKTERLKMGLMQRLLTKGIGHERFKESEVGRVPEKWEVVQVGDVTKEHKQGFYTDENYSDDGINLVRITDLQNHRISYSTMPKIKIDENTFKQFKVDAGDFLIARSLTVYIKILWKKWRIMENQVRISDLTINYEIVHRNIKYPRLEFKTGRLLLILPDNNKDCNEIIEKHRDWICK